MVNTFILSHLSFHLCAGVVPKKPLSALDKVIKVVGKRWLNLPQRTSVEPLYLPYKAGRMNLMPTNLLADIAQVVHGLRLLTLRDPCTHHLTLDMLTATMSLKARHMQPTMEDLAAFLSGATNDFSNHANNTSSTWT